MHACEWKECNILGVLDLVVSCGCLRRKKKRRTTTTKLPNVSEKGDLVP